MTRARRSENCGDRTASEARPSAETGHYRSVRPLCEEYWNPATQQRLAGERGERSPFGDMELVTTGRHAPTSWDGVMADSRGDANCGRMVLRTDSSVPQFAEDDHVRLLDVHVTIPEDAAESLVATLTALSEVFLVARR